MSEKVIERLHVLHALLKKFALDAEVLGEGSESRLIQTCVDINGKLEDALRLGLGDFFDVHTTVRTRNDPRNQFIPSNHHGATHTSVEENGKVEFLLDVHSTAHEDLLAENALGAGLLGVELVADHLLSVIGNFLGTTR